MSITDMNVRARYPHHIPVFVSASELCRVMRRHRGSRQSCPPGCPPASKDPKEAAEPHWGLIDFILIGLITVSIGFNWARTTYEGVYCGWQFSWQLQLAVTWLTPQLRKHLPLAVVGDPLERVFCLATAVLPALRLRWLCPDLWMALSLIYRLGLLLPPLVAARLTELRAARMQTFPEHLQPDQQIIVTLVKI